MFMINIYNFHNFLTDTNYNIIMHILEPVHNVHNVFIMMQAVGCTGFSSFEVSVTLEVGKRANNSPRYACICVLVGRSHPLNLVVALHTESPGTCMPATF